MAIDALIITNILLLNYFRINDPYRLIIIFVLLILLRLPFLLSSDWQTIPELSWQVTAERMNEGALLYADIRDDIGPLSAFVYRGIDFLFGRSWLALQILGLLVFFFHIALLNHITLQHKLIKENNYLPALFYGLLGVSFFNIAVLSPMLMGLTFVLLACNRLFAHIGTRNKTDANLLDVGIYTGIASLFYLPLIFTVIIHFAGLIYFTNTIPRRYLLMIFGLFIPGVLIWLAYYWHGHTYEFYVNFFYKLFHTHPDHFLSFAVMAKALALPAAFFLIAALKTLSGLGFTIFQIRIQKVIFLAFIIMVFIWVLYANRDGYELILFLPWMAFFLTHFFISFRKRFKAELAFTMYVVGTLFIYYAMAYGLFQFTSELEPVMVKEIPGNPPYKGHKTLVLGPDINPYSISRQATPYFKWYLSESQLTNLDYYDNLEAIYKNILSDMPEYIVDEIELAPKIFYKIPRLGAEYKAVTRRLYKRKSNN